MIHHFSMPAVDTKLVSEVLQEIFDGRVTNFNPTENAYMVWFGDEYGSAIEVYPADIELRPGSNEDPCEFHKTRTSEYSPFHVAISVDCSQEKLHEIGDRLGWRTVEFRRGSFRVVEFWVENRIMFELLPADMTAEYLLMTKQYQK